MQRHILVVNDHEPTCRKLQEMLEENPKINVDMVLDGAEALKALTEQNYSVFLTDLHQPGLDGMFLIEEIQKRRIPVTVIVMTGQGSIEDAVQAMRLGAYDFLTKPVDLRHVCLVVKRVLRERLLQDEVFYLRDRLQRDYSFHHILSKNSSMHAVFELVSNVAQTNSTVLIEGETGTGKEQVAQALHQTSLVRNGPMIAVNCAALPENLLESELFGHEKGAFTSAVGQRRGRFEMAHGGTIFLDEVGDIPPSMQAKLLRVLQERRFERVGGAETIEVDVRVVAATNRSLQRLVQEGRFREDLYYRLNVVKVVLPPLRDRPEDIPVLAEFFTQKYARPGETAKRISPQCMDLLLHYRWPGNIRELENAIERACVTSLNGEILPENLPGEILMPQSPVPLVEIDLNCPLPDLLREVGAHVEEQYLRRALEACHGNVGRCAKICGMSRRSISAKITAYHINKNVFKDMPTTGQIAAQGFMTTASNRSDSQIIPA